jgi:hypothetical protein
MVTQWLEEIPSTSATSVQFSFGPSNLSYVSQAFSGTSQLSRPPTLTVMVLILNKTVNTQGTDNENFRLLILISKDR